MKKIFTAIILLLCALQTQAQGISGITVEPMCWTYNSVDSTVYAYWIFTSRDSTPWVKSYLNSAGNTVNISAGGTLVPGYCGQPTASTYLDSLSVLEDSIIVLYAQDGTEITRDTVGPFGGGGSTFSVLASNGLNDQDGSSDVDVELGGILERNTTVTGDDFTYTMSWDSLNLYSILAGNANGEVTVDMGSPIFPYYRLYRTNDSTIQRIQLEKSAGEERIIIQNRNPNTSETSSFILANPGEASIVANSSDVANSIGLEFHTRVSDTSYVLFNTPQRVSGNTTSGQVLTLISDQTGKVEFSWVYTLGDTSAMGMLIDEQNSRIIVGQSGATYDLPYRDPDAAGLPPGEYLATFTELGARGGTEGWVNVDDINAIVDDQVLAVDISDTEYVSLATTKISHLTVIAPDTITQNYAVTLPNPLTYSDANQTLTITSKSESDQYGYYLETADTIYARLSVDGYPAHRYYLENETVEVSLVGNSWVIERQQENARIIPGADQLERERFAIGEYIAYGARNTPYQIISGTYSTVDNSTIFQVKEKVARPINYFYNSEVFSRTGISNAWNWDDQRFDIQSNTRDLRGPTGKFNATRIIKTTTANNASIRQGYTGLALGDTLTVSFWVRTPAEADTNFIRVRLRDNDGFLPTIANEEDITSDWRQFFYTWTKRVAGDDQIYFYIDGTDGLGEDTIYFAEPHLYLGESRTTYIRTSSSELYGNDTVYAVPVLYESPPVGQVGAGSDNILYPNRTFNIDDFDWPAGTRDVDKFRQAIDICETTEKCDIIEFYEDKTFDQPGDTVSVPEFFTIHGIGDPRITVTGSAPNETVFTSEDTNAANYTEGQRYYGFTLDVQGARYRGIYLQNTLNQYVDNVKIQGNDSLFIGYQVGEVGTLGALLSHVDNTTVQETQYTGGLYRRCGNLHFINGLKTKRGRNGLIVRDIGLFSIFDWDCEQNDSLAMVVQQGGNLIEIKQSYFENQNGPNGLPAFDIKGLSNFRYINSFNTDSDRFSFDSVGVAVFNGNEFNGGLTITKSPFTKVDVSFNNFDREYHINRLESAWGQDPTVTLLLNSFQDDGDAGGQANNYIHRLISKLSRLIEPVIENATIGDTTYVTDLTLIGKVQNLAEWSDSIPEVVRTNIVIESNYGDATYPEADLVRAIGTGDGGIFNIVPATSVKAGEEYTFSIWAKRLNVSQTSSATLFVQLGTTNYRLGYFNDTLWHEYAVTGKPDINDSFISVEMRDQSVGDSILFVRRALHEGNQVLPYVETGATSIDSVGIAVIHGDKRFTGDFQRTDRAEGNENTTTDGTGDVTITHSLGFTPTNINITPLGTGGSPLLPQVLSNTINSTTFTVRWFTPSTGLAATSAAVNFHWSAE